MGGTAVGVRAPAHALSSSRGLDARTDVVIVSLRERVLPGSGAVLDEVVVTVGAVIVLADSRPQAEEHADRLRWIAGPDLEAAGLEVWGWARPRAARLRRLVRRLPSRTDGVMARRLARRLDELLLPAEPTLAATRPGLVRRTRPDGVIEVRDATGLRLALWRPWDGALILSAARYEAPVRLALGLTVPDRRPA